MLKRETTVVFDSEGNLYLSKSRGEKISSLYFIFGLPVILALAIFWLLPKVKPNLKLDFQIIGFLLLFCAYILISYFNMVVKCIKNRNCVLSKRIGNVIVKKKIFCEQKDLVSVIVQPLVGSRGIGMSYTIGLESKEKSIPISFFHGKEESFLLASEIARFYEVEVIEKKPFSFSFFRKF